MPPSEAYFWAELEVQLRLLGHIFDVVTQTLVAYFPAFLMAVLIVLVVGLAALCNASARSAGTGLCLIAEEIVVTEAGTLAVFREKRMIAANICNTDSPLPERAPQNQAI